jgi:polyketide biosynthesis 3-hydroxy-3-methylglutaryl-CoA synthase-like enzyme PksG
LVSLASTIEQGVFDVPKRIGCFSYGSGCCSEFYSGVAMASGQQKLRAMELEQNLDSRYQLNMDEYETLLEGSNEVKFGTRNVVPNTGLLPGVWQSIIDNTAGKGTKRIFLKEIKEFYRQYEWVG